MKKKKKYDINDLSKVTNFKLFIHEIFKIKLYDYLRGDEYLKYVDKSLEFWNKGVMYKFDDQKLKVHHWDREEVEPFIKQEILGDDVIKYTLDKKKLMKSAFFQKEVKHAMWTLNATIEGNLALNAKLEQHLLTYSAFLPNGSLT